MMLLPPIHATQSPHAFCRLRPSPGSCYVMYGETERSSRPDTGKAKRFKRELNSENTLNIASTN